MKPMKAPKPKVKSPKAAGGKGLKIQKKNLIKKY